MATEGKGKRLSPQAKKAIINASDDLTNTELAKKFKTTPQTIARYRSGKAKAPAVTQAATKVKQGATKIGAKQQGAVPGTLAVGTAKAKGNISVVDNGDTISLQVPKSLLLGEVLPRIAAMA